MWWLRAAVLVLALCSMGWLTVGTGGTFASPDENANAFFARTLANAGTFCAPEPLNVLAEGLIHPRSTVGPGTCVLPSTFLGFPAVTGFVQFLFGDVGMFLVTPIIAIAAVMSFWWLVRRMTDNDRLADIAALLLLSHPAFWYYSARVMMHNVAFVGSLIIGIELFIRSHQKSSVFLAAVSGAVAAVGLSMRLVEAPIFFVIATIIVVVYRRSLPWKILGAAACGGAFILGFYLIINHQIYGSAFATGYNLPDVRIESTVASEGGATIVDRISALLLPFGFHPRAILRNVLQYGFSLYPLTSILAIVGAIVAWRSTTHRKMWRTLVVCLVVAAAWMGVVYGSWSMADNTDPRAVTVGNSHVRYWLPLFAAASILVPLGITNIARHFFKDLRAGRIVLAVSLLVVLALNARIVFGGSDGLLATRAALHTFVEKREILLEITEDDAVIVVDRADKYLFPSRRVIVPLRSESTYAIMPTLAPIVPLYYFGITLPDADVMYLNQKKLSPLGLEIVHVQTIQEESLYRIQLPVAR